ncbi:MAG: class I SAM-dependent methyltransferase [Thermodesulfovibrionia bacterium]|nr:class I SAM-dependent methyltransferase [Thermodesulfovibrionia bacterium]
MIRETYYFFRHGPKVQKRQKEMGLVEFQKDLARRVDTDGYAELRSSLVGDLEGDVLEIGTGTGATFQYYGPHAKVTAVEPHDGFRAAATEAAKNAKAEIQVISGKGENLPFEDTSFDAVSASQVLCSVTSPLKTLEEFKRVLRPDGQLRLLEHVRSEHWLAGPMMDLFNPIWLRINKIGCNWNRKTVEDVQNAGFKIRSIEPYKIYSKDSPAAFPIRIIKAERPA